MYRLRHILSLFAVALLFAACTQDDEQSGNSLSDGQYPLVLTATVEGMTTRSDGKDAWTGDGSEYIGVRMVSGETTTESKYVIGNTTGTSVLPADGSATLYWQNSDPATITSWYPYDDQADIDISDQSSLEDFSSIDYLTATVENQLYGNTVDLKFKHQMAKVSYTLKAGDGFTDDDLTNAIVLFAGYTTASFSKGELTGTTDGWITPTSDKDVLLVPQDMTGKQFIKVSVNGSSYVFTPTDADLQAGCHYIYNITVSATGLDVTVSSTSVDWESGSSASETVYMGDGYTYSTDANGTRSYTVYNETGLNAWSEYTRTSTDENHWSTNCTLANDITLTAVESGSSNWTAVGPSSSDPYTGTFDGNGYTITGLTISASSARQGLIGCLGSDGEVKNLTLEKVSISSTSGSFFGAVVGYNNGTVTNCYTSGEVSGSWYTGGVVGNNYKSGTVTDCYSTCTVKGSEWYTGGVVGENNGGIVTACYSTGEVSGTNYVGGVVGDNGYNGPVTACYATGSISGTIQVGGVVGYNNKGTVTACYATGSVSGDDDIGGVVGYNNTSNGASVNTCYWYNDATNGIGYDDSSDSGSDENATKIEGDVTWTDAKTAMNTALTGTGWQYDGDGTSTPPLTLVTE